MITLGQAKPILSRVVAGGVSASDPRVVLRINEACQRLYGATDFVGKRERYNFCARQAVITLPRHLETVVGANVSGGSYDIRPDWFEFLPEGPLLLNSGSCSIGALVDRGDGYPGFHDVCGPHYLKVYSDLPEDAGAKILITGLDENLNEVQTLVAGSWIMGEYVGLNNATPQISTKRFSKVLRYQKPKTNGPIRVYQYTPPVAEVPGYTIETQYLTSWVLHVPGSSLGTLGSGTIGFSQDGVSEDSVYYVRQVSDDAGSAFAELYRTVGSVTSLLEVISATGDGHVHCSIGDFTFPAASQADQTTTTIKLVTTHPVEVPPVPEIPAVQSCIAILDSGEEIPSLRRYLIPGVPTAGDTCVTLLAQRRWLEVSRDSDPLYPSNLGALKHMLLSLEKEERNELQAAFTHEEKAIQILKAELKQHLGPAAQTLNISMRGFGANWAQVR